MLEQPSFGRRLKELRLERRMSQSDLAAGGMSTGYLSRLESGARRPTQRAVTFLARRLGVPPSAFESTPAPSLAQVLASVASTTGDDDSERLAAAVLADDHKDSALRWQALWQLARIRGEQGRLDERRTLLAELTELSDQLGVPQLQVRSRTQWSSCLQELGDNVAARRHASEAYDLAVSHRLPVSDVSAALHILVSAEAETGRLTDARAHADELCELVANASRAELTMALWAAATVHVRQGDYAGALQRLEQALDGLDSRDDLVLWTRLRLAAASLYLQVVPPLPDKARARLDEAAPVLDLIGSALHRQEMLALRAHLAAAENRPEDARQFVRELAAEESLLSFRDRVRVDALHGRLLIQEGRAAEGVKILQELARQVHESLNVDLAAEIWRLLAETLSTGTLGTGTLDEQDPALSGITNRGAP